MEEEGSEIKTCLCFVPLGVAAKTPTRFDVEDEANKKQQNPTKPNSTKSLDGEAASTQSTSVPLPADLRMDEYDDEDDVDAGARISVLSEQDLKLINQGDPLVDPAVLAEEDDDRDEDLEIDPQNDYPIVLGAVVADEDAAVETVIYSREDSANYAHHSIITDAYPLALEWLPVFKTCRRKNIIAVASFLPTIEIYDNDVIDQLEPIGVLEGQQSMKHSDAVSALSLNPIEPHLLLSASHDNSAIVWDLKTLRPVKHYPDLTTAKKINTAAWSPNGRQFAVAGDSKEFIVVNSKTGAKSVLQSPEEIESLTWIDEVTAAAVTQEGSLLCYEVDKTANLKLVSETTVCDGPLLSICITKGSQLLVTGSEAGTAFVYDFKSARSLKKLHEKKMENGPLYDVKPSPDIDHLVAFAANDVVVWDLAYETVIQQSLNITVPE